MVISEGPCLTMAHHFPIITCEETEKVENSTRISSEGKI